jgi:hypothetical protein
MNYLSPNSKLNSLRIQEKLTIKEVVIFTRYESIYFERFVKEWAPVSQTK